MWRRFGSVEGDLRRTYRLFFHARKGYKLASLKGRYYGQEEEEAALLDFNRSP